MKEHNIYTIKCVEKYATIINNVCIYTSCVSFQLNFLKNAKVEIEKIKYYIKEDDK